MLQTCSPKTHQSTLPDTENVGVGVPVFNQSDRFSCNIIRLYGRSQWFNELALMSNMTAQVNAVDLLGGMHSALHKAGQDDIVCMERAIESNDIVQVQGRAGAEVQFNLLLHERLGNAQEVTEASILLHQTSYFSTMSCIRTPTQTCLRHWAVSTNFDGVRSYHRRQPRGIHTILPKIKNDNMHG